jgi:ABC-2 type transport system ATP-binding protein
MPIVVNNLSKKYGQQVAVNNLSFSAQEGEIIGFLGPNGAGKTTTFKMLTGFIQPTSGHIEINGQSIIGDPLVARRSIGYLPESNPLYGDMYVLEFLRFIADTHHLKNSKQDLINACHQVGMGSELNKKVKQLSKGFRQRVGLAQAILHNPPILILDEPTTGLDANQLIDIRRMIKDLGKDKLILFSSHIMQEIESMCDRVIILDKGVKIADNELADIASTTQSEYTIIMDLEMPCDNVQSYENTKGVMNLQTQDNKTIYITVTTGHDPRAELFKTAVANGDVIIHLSKEGQTFEQTFQKLTRKP